jgi:arylsulfatase A-like enzyme
MKISVKKLNRRSTLVSAYILFCGVVGMILITGYSSVNDKKTVPSHPNILFIMVDQMQTPPEGYGPEEGVAQGLKEILGFRTLSPGNEYTRFFPGLTRLRDHGVVFGKHYTTTAACVPSRACTMTGQYPNMTGVDQTDGLFKSSHDIPWLDSMGAPTIGDWFRAAGYTTHYFGKWHVSEISEETKSLEPWGFSDFESSYPEPHAGGSSNAGAFRDVVFTENVVKFLKKKGTENSNIPWLSVASLVNPHDCGLWPIPWQAPSGTGVVTWTNYPPPPSIPAMGQKSRMTTIGDTTFQAELNPDGFPQENSFLPRTYNESLVNKPRCQQDYALKWGLSQESNINYNLQNTSFRSPHPFQLQGSNASAWSLSYNQFYIYYQYLADLQIRRILKALDESGLTENTIIVLLSDHGDMAGAHGGMIQKWHTAYEEAIRVPMIISSPLVNASKNEMRIIHQPTSSIDLAPTLLALAGFDENQLRTKIEATHANSVVKPFAGANLASQVKGTGNSSIVEPDGSLRTGVLFMSNDMITESGTINPSETQKVVFQAYLDNVQSRISAGIPLVPGPVRQPNNVRAFCTGDWKIVRYFDPNGIETDEWELYNLTTDPVEQINLVDFRTGEVLDNVNVNGLTKDELIAKNSYLKSELSKHEALVTGIPDSPAISPKLELYQNYPNPLNHQTTISFHVAETGTVRLTITDLNGKEVQVLLNKNLSAGSYNQDFEAGQLPSGIYFIRLISGSQQMVKTIIINKY